MRAPSSGVQVMRRQLEARSALYCGSRGQKGAEAGRAWQTPALAATRCAASRAGLAPPAIWPPAQHACCAALPASPYYASLLRPHLLHCPCLDGLQPVFRGRGVLHLCKSVGTASSLRLGQLWAVKGARWQRRWRARLQRRQGQSGELSLAGKMARHRGIAVRSRPPARGRARGRPPASRLTKSCRSCRVALAPPATAIRARQSREMRLPWLIMPPAGCAGFLRAES